MKLIFGLMICFCAFLMISGNDKTKCTFKGECPCRYSYEPVCATNGCSYANPCFMECAKAKFSKQGPCKQHPYY